MLTSARRQNRVRSAIGELQHVIDSLRDLIVWMDFFAIFTSVNQGASCDVAKPTDADARATIMVACVLSRGSRNQPAHSSFRASVVDQSRWSRESGLIPKTI